jgi:dihydrofolate reductase
MPKVVLFIAKSIDGYIARPDGRLDWLTTIPSPEKGDYGYAELLNNTEMIIMGRRTYDEIIGFGVEWPYEGFKTYVVTKNSEYKVQSPETFLINDNLKKVILQMKKTAKKDIWLVGGGELNTAFLNEGLIDKLIITVIPKIIGEGIPLFSGKSQDSKWKLIETKSFNTGVVNLIYEKSF